MGSTQFQVSLYGDHYNEPSRFHHEKHCQKKEAFAHPIGRIIKVEINLGEKENVCHTTGGQIDSGQNRYEVSIIVPGHFYQMNVQNQNIATYSCQQIKRQNCSTWDELSSNIRSTVPQVKKLLSRILTNCCKIFHVLHVSNFFLNLFRINIYTLQEVFHLLKLWTVTCKVNTLCIPLL